MQRYKEISLQKIKYQILRGSYIQKYLNALTYIKFTLQR